MKKAIWSCIVAAFLILWLWELAPGRLALPNNRAILRPTKDGTKIEGQIVLSNPGFFPVKLTSIRSSCGCVVIAPTKNIVPARSSLTVKLEGEIPKYKNNSSAIITFESTDPFARIQSMEVVLDGSNGITAVPQDLAFDEKGGTLSLYGVSKDIKDVTISCDTGEFNFTVDREGDEVKISLNPLQEAVGGFFQIPFQLNANGIPIWRGTATGKLQSPFLVLPQILYPSDHTVNVTVRGLDSTEDFEIAEIIGLAELGLTCESVIVKERSHVLSIRKLPKVNMTSAGVVFFLLKDSKGATYKHALSVSP
jgi:hypothetical protein